MSDPRTAQAPGVLEVDGEILRVRAPEVSEHRAFMLSRVLGDEWAEKFRAANEKLHPGPLVPVFSKDAESFDLCARASGGS